MLNIPARFISGYCLPGETEADPLLAAHCWAEAYADGFGWIGFDPAIGICPQENYVRIACGLDWLGAAHARVAHIGLTKESIDEKIEMKPSDEFKQAV
jgi:transglutaminase-like putative cysteine protease